MLVLGSDELNIPEVGGFDDVLLLVVAEPEPYLELRQVVEWDGSRRHRDHHRLGHIAPFIHLVQGGQRAGGNPHQQEAVTNHKLSICASFKLF